MPWVPMGRVGMLPDRPRLMTDTRLLRQLAEAERRFDEKDPDSALEIVTRILGEDSESVPARRLSATLLTFQNRYDDALEDLHVVLNGPDVVPFDLFYAGRWSARMHDHENSVAYLTRSIDLGRQTDDPICDSICLIHRAFSLIQLGRYDEAMDDCRAMPGNSVIYRSRVIRRPEMIEACRARRPLPLNY